MALSVNAQTLPFKNLKSSKPIYYKGINNFTISNDSINGGASPCIYLINCNNVHITHCKLQNSTDMGVHLNNCSNVLIDSNYLVNLKNGVYAEVCPLGSIRTLYNQIAAIQGTIKVQQNDPIQYNRVNGANNKINFNLIQNKLGASHQEDGINLYMCNGIANDPIQVIGNRVSGGGASTTGSGITVGDQGGSYELIKDNFVCNSGYVGIQVAGGHHISIMNNTIFSTSFPWSGCGLASSNYISASTGYLQSSQDNTISGNKVNWIAGHLGGYRRDTAYKSANNNQMPAGWKTTNIIKANINSSILPTKLF